MTEYFKRYCLAQMTNERIKKTEALLQLLQQC